jgi:hypothetical protein
MKRMQTGCLELKTIVSETKSILLGTTGKLDSREGKIRELEEIAMETIKTEIQCEKTIIKKKMSRVSVNCGKNSSDPHTC